MELISFEPTKSYEITCKTTKRPRKYARVSVLGPSLQRHREIPP